MAIINFENVCLDYPVYGGQKPTIQNSLKEISTGGVFTKNEKNELKIRALNNLSFTINEGDSVGLIGHNGAGKTTLLRTMAGIYHPTKGKVHISGTISTVIELGSGLDANLTGLENIIRLGLLYGLKVKEINDLLPEIEDFTELGDFLNSPVSTYSSGMLMRLMFAVVTSKFPDILIVDEMFSTGDANFQVKAEARMINVINQSKIFIFASHSTALIEKFCNRVFKLEHGNIIEIFK
jgi:ABC-type polysaccharide/polyol phosphate transport system ATPase subunit